MAVSTVKSGKPGGASKPPQVIAPKDEGTFKDKFVSGYASVLRKIHKTPMRIMLRPSARRPCAARPSKPPGVRPHAACEHLRPDLDERVL